LIYKYSCFSSIRNASLSDIVRLCSEYKCYNIYQKDRDRNSGGVAVR